jgi:hypothetical protein
MNSGMPDRKRLYTLTGECGTDFEGFYSKRNAIAANGHGAASETKHACKGFFIYLSLG